MTGAENAAHRDRQRADQARGCGIAVAGVGVLVLVALIIDFWSVALPMLAFIGAFALWRRRSSLGVAAAQRHGLVSQSASGDGACPTAAGTGNTRETR